MQPIAHTSTAGEFPFSWPDRTSGHMYLSVPERTLGFTFSATPEIPKSATYNWHLVYFDIESVLLREQHVLELQVPMDDIFEVAV